MISLINELIRADGGERVDREALRPTLVLEGIGGSGRSEVLRHTWEKWSGKAPTAFVDPVAVADDDPDSMRNVLIAVMLGLTADVPGYKISFPRLVLAHIAMAGPIPNAGNPRLSVQALKERISDYHDHGQLTALVGGLARAAVAFLRIPGVDIVAGTVAEQVVGRLRRTGWPAKLVWGDALSWFGHQDQGFQFQPEEALVRLSVQAQNEDLGVGEDVDVLLMAALLADLRDGFARAVNHTANAVVLVDNGDAPSAAEFIRTLAKVRRRLERRHQPRDPLVVITASGGLLAASADDRPSVWPESDLAELTTSDVVRAGTSLRVALRGFDVGDIESMEEANSSRYVGSSVISSTIHRHTGGHAVSTILLLNHLTEQPHEEHPRLINDLGAMLASIQPQAGRTLDEYLIDKIVSGLSPRRIVDPQLRDDLITLAAARDQAEARLLIPLTGNPDGPFMLSTLWSDYGPREHPALPPFVRNTLLRALVIRPADHRASWNEVFATLRSHAERSDDDVAGLLHHELALGNRDTVVDELTRQVSRMPGETWLALLDQTVATPRLSSPAPYVDDGSRPKDDREAVARLVACHQALSDSRLSDRKRLGSHYRAIGRAYYHLGKAEFLERQQQYQRLAEKLA